MEKISVMLADDHVLVRESIRKFLEEEDTFQVLGEAGNGEIAVQMACQLKPDILIMDIDMPNLNGIEATKQIKKLCPRTAVLILTAYDYEQYIFALLEAGASGYLLKDISGRELVSAARAIYRGESVLHPVIAGKVMKQLRAGGRRDQKNAEPLTGREKEVLLLAALGLKNKQIAQRLFVSVRTIEAHFGNIFTKLGVVSRTEAVLVSLTKGWIRIEQLKGGGIGEDKD